MWKCPSMKQTRKIVIESSQIKGVIFTNYDYELQKSNDQLLGIGNVGIDHTKKLKKNQRNKNFNYEKLCLKKKSEGTLFLNILNEM